MTTSPGYVVQPLSKIPRVELKDVFRVYLSSTALQLQKLHPGDLCTVLTGGEIKGPVIVWPSLEKIQDSRIQISKPLQSLYEIKLNDRVSLSCNNELAKDSTNIQVREIFQPNQGTPPSTLNEVHKVHWLYVLKHILQKAELICPGVLLEGVELVGEKRTFEVIDVNSSSDRILYRVQPKTKISIKDASLQDESNEKDFSKVIQISSAGIGGLEKQMNQLNEILADYNHENQVFIYPQYYRPSRGGILLYGASGTGKSTILRNLAQAGWRKVLQVDTSAIDYRSNDISVVISRTFIEARRNQPSLIIFDGIELLAAKRNLHSDETLTNITPSLSKEFDRLEGDRVLVVAATSSLTNLDERLRIPGRFDHEIEIPVPSSKARAEILKVLHGQASDVDIQMLEALAERTHGFVGADLESLIQRAVKKAKARLSDRLSSTEAMRGNADSKASPEITIKVMPVDLDEALLEIRPTAMREVFLQTPNIRWSDIGGQYEVKKSLAQAIEWPFKYPTEMNRLGIEPKKGLLLYGPPGCSKTLTAKAVATESGLNFLAVKGGELLSMYVGESERAVREVFRKARSASPSILFFDEIDAIGGLREGNGQHGGLNIVTTLLNELDGIELLKGVFVIAATNKPEILDPALMRPGRFGTKLFVGLPGYRARREIIHITISKMDVDVNVSPEKLTAQTQGYSGAELVSICQKAGFAALEDQIYSGTRQRISSKHFEDALKETPREISRQDIERYQKWGAQESPKPGKKRTLVQYIRSYIRKCPPDK